MIRTHNIRGLIRAGGGKIREPVSSKMKKKALEKANYKCQWRGCKVKHPMPLDVHHMNMRNDDNRVANFRVFCPTHHRMWHQQNKPIVKRDPLGNRVVIKVVKKKKSKTKKVVSKKRKKNSTYDWIMRS